MGVGLYYLIPFFTVNQTASYQYVVLFKNKVISFLASAFCAIPIALSVGLFFEGIALFNNLTQNSLLHIYMGCLVTLLMSKILYKK